MRLAWFTPLPPVRSGIAAYSAELLPRLCAGHAIDVFVESAQPSEGPSTTLRTGSDRVLSAHEFVWRHFRAPYDLVVYQLGNAEWHDYMWPYVFRYPGVVVMHDAQLHHARARALLGRGRQDDYRREFAYNHPGARPGAAEFAVAGLRGSLYYFWPMVRAVVRSARLVAFHSPVMAQQCGIDYPGATVASIAMGVPEPQPSAGARESIRARHGIASDAVVFCAFGKVTPEKRIAPIVAALAALAKVVPSAHLLVAGETTKDVDVQRAARASGVADRVTVTGFVPDEAVADYLAASDVCLCLRWPTSRETSASWLRCLAAGKATVVTDLAQTVDVPALDPRNWTIVRGDETDEPAAPVVVSVDILDEDHSLRLAMRRLAEAPALRADLAANALAFWSRGHTLERMAADYERTLARACERPAPRLHELPAHLRDDGSALTREILDRIGVAPTALGWDLT